MAIIYETEPLKDGVKLVSIKGNQNGGDLTIPSEINGKRIYSIGRDVFATVNMRFGTVIVPPNINIEALTFSYAPVKEFRLPKSLTRIPSLCFHGSTVEKIVFEDPTVVTFIGELAFKECMQLTEFHWPPNCKTLTNCFAESGVKKLTGIENVEFVWDGAFHRTNIAELVWPSRCKAIPKNCFESSRITKLTGTENVTRIEDEAFIKTYNLKEFVWPKNCKTIPKACFKNSKLTHITGIEGVETVRSSAFSYTDIQSITWPKNCKIIPESCFEGSKLCSISGIENVNLVYPYSFARLDMECFLFPAACKEVEFNTFYRTSMKSLKICSESIFLRTGDLPEFLDVLDLTECSNVNVGSSFLGEFENNPNIWGSIGSVKKGFDTEIVLVKE